MCVVVVVVVVAAAAAEVARKSRMEQGQHWWSDSASLRIDVATLQ